MMETEDYAIERNILICDLQYVFLSVKAYNIYFEKMPCVICTLSVRSVFSCLLTAVTMSQLNANLIASF
jgi:hypothetical protein